MRWYIQRLKNIYHWLMSVVAVTVNGYPARKLTVIGVTGTDGKTTTSTLIYEMLKASGIKAALISTVEARIGSETVDTGLHTTNPDARQLQPLLKKMVNQGITHLVLEVTAHGLDQYRVWGCNFRIGVLTNITHEHLDDFVSMEKYREAKTKLFTQVKQAVLNKDDASYEYLRSKCNGRCEVAEYGPTQLKEISPALTGDYNKYNIGAAETVARLLKLPEKQVRYVVKTFQGVRGRREEIRAGQKFRVIVDFAHTPNALEQLLGSFPGRKIVVFGCTGERDRTKRPMMGEAAARLADEVIVTSDDTRSESQDDIYAQIVRGIKTEDMGRVVKQNDRRKAIETAMNMAKPGDTVILAGKGHEKTILIGKNERPWSDQEVAREVINSLKGRLPS